MSDELVHTGRRICVYVNTTVTPTGTTIRRDLIRHPGAVVILPVLNESEIVLLQNHRFTVGETLWEIPAGTLEPGEDLTVCAHRELQEETGYLAGRMESLGFLYASPGVLDEKLHLHIAHDLTPGPQSLEPDEDIHVHTVSLDEAVRMCLDGRIRDCKTITAILLYERRLRG